ncbi:MAG: signal peptide peptidase SppA, partial [Deltaproteobacteria bacterium]|nr:signal peptide peptidase SppA [Deltaproteobacteria bacterium]
PVNWHQGAIAGVFNLFEGFDVGLGMHLAFPKDQTDTDKGLVNGQFSLAYRFGRVFSMGLWMEKQRRYAMGNADPFLFGFGIQHYPIQWLSWGATAKQVYGDFNSPYEFQVGVAFRPYLDEITLFAETRFWPNGDTWNAGYDVSPITGIRFDLEEGSISAQVVIQKNPLFFFGIDMNFDHFGFGPLGGNDYTGARFKISGESSGSLRPAAKQWVQVEINPSGTLNQEFRSLSAYLFQKRVSPLSFLASLDELAKDESVEGVVIHLQSLNLGFGRAEELRDSVLALKNSGKQVIVYLNNAKSVDYYVASAASKIYLNPAANLQFDDFRKTMIHLKDGLNELGIKAQAIVAGKYKNAPRFFTASGPNEREIEVTKAILDERYEEFVQALSAKTERPSQEVKKQLDLGRLTPPEAEVFGLVDGVMQKDEIPESKNRFVNYFGQRRKIKRWGTLDRIAVIPIHGQIIRGHANPSVFFPKALTGADDIVRAVEIASKDPHTKGIILRVNSPGGDAFGSEQIYQALMKAREKKPIVTSMADVAASGGYFAAAATDEIWAEPSTLTGSIGVFSLTFSGRELLDKYGVNSQELKKTELVGPSFFRPLNEAELKRGQHLVDYKYARFKKAVADGQDIPLEHVSQVAEGRVWTGTQALKNELVHRMGGFPQALKSIKRRVGIEDSTPYDLIVYNPTGFNWPNLSLNPFATIEYLMEHQGESQALMPLFLL